MAIQNGSRIITSHITPFWALNCSSTWHFFGNTPIWWFHLHLPMDLLPWFSSRFVLLLFKCCLFVCLFFVTAPIYMMTILLYLMTPNISLSLCSLFDDFTGNTDIALKNLSQLCIVAFSNAHLVMASMHGIWKLQSYHIIKYNTNHFGHLILFPLPLKKKFGPYLCLMISPVSTDIALRILFPLRVVASSNVCLVMASRVCRNILRSPAALSSKTYSSHT